MSLIERKFKDLSRKGEGALITYITGGDPKPSLTPIFVEALIEGGADIIELGVPFSDPIADGPTIQTAYLRALKAGVTIKSVLAITQKIKSSVDIPIVILTYYNPVYKMGLKKFLIEASNSGVDGIVIPDLPVEEAEEYRTTASIYGIDTIFLATPATKERRLVKIINSTSGFLYLVSLFGITGVRDELQNTTLRTFKRVKSYMNEKIPLAVGFGISKPEHIKRLIDEGVDGVIVGSLLVKIIEKNLGKLECTATRIRETVKRLKEATNKTVPSHYR